MEQLDPSLIASAVCGINTASSPVTPASSLLLPLVPTAIEDFDRLAALQNTALLDSPAEDAFDRLTRLARRVLNVPVALVSLVDDHRQFFKSADGLPEPWASQRETPLSHSFCQHVVTQAAPLVVEDARLDPLVRDNLAVRDLGVIAYAGMPLTLSNGHVLGSFAAIDVVPRKWSEDDLTTLRDLAAAAMTEAELRGALEEAQRQTRAARTTEAALASTQERYELAVRGSKDGLWDWDITNNRVINSPRWKAMLGYDEQELPDDMGVWDALLHPEDQSQALSALNNYLAGRTSEYEIEYRMRHKDGSYRWVLARGYALRDAGGIAYRMAGSHSDITTRRMAEEALRESETALAEAQKVAQIGSWRLDITSRRYLWSRQLYLLYGFDPEQPMPSNDVIRLRAHKDDLETIAGMVARCIVDREKQVLHYRIHRADNGELRHLYAILNPQVDAHGQTTHLFGTVMDVTTQKEEETERARLMQLAQEARTRADDARAKMEVALDRETTQAALLRRQSVELARARDEAVRHAQTKSEFLANMSHEIRTPMNGVLGMTGLLLETTLSATQRDYAQTINASASALLTVINDILDFSKIESGKLILEEMDFDLRALIEQTTAILAPPAHAKGLELTCRMIPAEPPLIVRGDGGRLRQVLTNLLGNAVKFTETGQVGVSAAVIGETATDVTLQICVTDTGIGIAKPRQEAIFESFIQADGSTTRRYGGTGLGLTISRRIISLMEGQIKVESEPGQGSTFTLELTLPKGDARLAERPADYKSLKGLRILIADDNAVNCQILSEQTAAWGCRAHAVSSGSAAIAALESEVQGAVSDPYKVILLDMQMPKIDGIETARRIREHTTGSAVPLILLSSGFVGDSSHEDLFDLVLSKPVRQSALQDALLRLAVRPGQNGAEKRQQEEQGEEGENGMEVMGSAGPEGVRVLLAEDNPVNQKVAAHLLRKWNTDVTVVNNGKEALDAAVAQAKKGTGFDMIFMDVQMPEMDGMTATASLRSRNVLSSDRTRRLPIIALTAHSMQGDRERCLASGMDDYLSKPINEADLRAVLVRWRPVTDNGVVTRSDAADSSGGESDVDAEGHFIVRRERLWECCGGDAELVVEVVEEFLQSVPAVLARLEKAVAGGDAPKVRFEAHTLRGSCRTVGADSLEFTCGLLEEGGAAGDLGAAPELLKRARTAAERLAPGLNRAAMETETAV